MVISLIHPHTCGFAKVAAWEATRTVLREMERDENESPKEYEDRKMELIFSRFVANFNGNNYNIYFNMFCEKLPALRKKFNCRNSRKIDEREKYLNVFSTENWKQLTPEMKAQHSLMDCKGCFNRYVEQSLFPVASRQFFGSKKVSPMFIAQNISSFVNSPPSVKCTQREAAEYAEAI